MEIVVCLITAVVAYFLGSIPSGFLAGKMMGLDIRKAGSGNIGATNAFRILGKTAGTIVLVADGLKGWIAAALLPGIVLGFFHSGGTAAVPEYLRIVAGIVVILGHNFTCWLKFKGGKGIATSAGVLAALVPLTFLIALATWIIFCVITRYVSVGSIAAAVSLPIACWFLYSKTMVAVTAMMAVLAIYKHKGNISRLMSGTENKIGRRDAPAEGGAS